MVSPCHKEYQHQRHTDFHLLNIPYATANITIVGCDDPTTRLLLVYRTGGYSPKLAEVVLESSSTPAATRSNRY